MGLINGLRDGLRDGLEILMDDFRSVWIILNNFGKIILAPILIPVSIGYAILYILFVLVCTSILFVKGRVRK